MSKKNMDFGIVLALRSVRIYGRGTGLRNLDGLAIPNQAVGVHAPPAELRAVAALITNNLPIWRTIKKEFLRQADWLEEYAAMCESGEEGPRQLQSSWNCNW